MIDLYYSPTPTNWKVSFLLEECGLPYRVVPVHIGRGEQFSPSFVGINPNARVPAIVDREPTRGGAPPLFSRRDSAVPRREGRSLLARGQGGPLPDHVVADVADE
jgi:hypothetical protein